MFKQGKATENTFNILLLTIDANEQEKFIVREFQPILEFIFHIDHSDYESFAEFYLFFLWNKYETVK